MEIIEFQGMRCIEKPKEEFDRWACKHTKKFVSSSNTPTYRSVQRILINGNRSADVCIIVAGPLPEIDLGKNPELQRTRNAILCNSCWVNIYDSTKL